jgi:hypothetical protein
MLTHGHQGAQAFRKNSFETAFVHVKWFYVGAQTPMSRSRTLATCITQTFPARIHAKVANLTFD